MTVRKEEQALRKTTVNNLFKLTFYVYDKTHRDYVNAFDVFNKPDPQKPGEFIGLHTEHGVSEYYKPKLFIDAGVLLSKTVQKKLLVKWNPEVVLGDKTTTKLGMAARYRGRGYKVKKKIKDANEALKLANEKKQTEIVNVQTVIAKQQVEEAANIVFNITPEPVELVKQEITPKIEFKLEPIQKIDRSKYMMGDYAEEHINTLLRMENMMMFMCKTVNTIVEHNNMNDTQIKEMSASIKEMRDWVFSGDVFEK